jgi:hypothetical protein
MESAKDKFNDLKFPRPAVATSSSVVPAVSRLVAIEKNNARLFCLFAAVNAMAQRRAPTQFDECQATMYRD